MFAPGALARCPSCSRAFADVVAGVRLAVRARPAAPDAAPVHWRHRCKRCHTELDVRTDRDGA